MFLFRVFNSKISYDSFYKLWEDGAEHEKCSVLR